MTERPIRVLLIEDNPGDGRLVGEFLSETKDQPQKFDLELIDRLSEGLDRLQRGGIDIVLLDLSLPDSQGLETFRRARARAGGVPIVILSGLADDALAMQAVREGAQDYLVKGSVRGHSLVRVIRYTIERRRAHDGLVDQSSKVASRVLGFIGGKGGAGTSTVALNVATAMAKQGHSVVAVETGPGWGAFSHLLNRTPDATMAGLFGLPPENIEPQTLAPLLGKTPDKLQILFGPQRAEEFQEVDPARAEAMVRGLAGMADYTIVDLPAYPCRASAAIVPHCNHVVLVSGRDAASVAAGKRALDLLTVWGARPGGMSAVLVSRVLTATPLSVSGPAVNTAEIGGQLGCDVIVVVPNALDACLRAQVAGLPLVAAEPGNPASARMLQIAEWLLARHAAVRTP